MRIGVGLFLATMAACLLSSAGAVWADEDCAAVSAAAKTGSLPGETYPAIRIYDLRRGTDAAELISYQGMLAELATADVIFLGEQHDDPVTHYMEWRILRDLTARHRGNQALSLEMFERDVQHQLSAYLRGELSEDEFMEASRPWPNYPSDYRPLIELAKAEGLPVVAANIPRPLASRVAKEGLDSAQDGYTMQEWFWVATEVKAPLDLYWELFYATMSAMMGGHGGDGADEAAKASNELQPGQEMVYQIYQAQCIKDDTMAESIARQRQRDPLRPVLHVNGCFHSDYLSGTLARVQSRRPQDKIVSVTLRPVLPLRAGDPQSEDLDPDWFSKQPRIADFFIFVPAPKPEPEPEREPEEAEMEMDESSARAMPLPAGV